MSVVLIVQEVKRNATGCTPGQAERWALWLNTYEPIGRVVEIPGTSTLIGNNWQVQCEDRAEAEWLTQWLIDYCGFSRTMLTIRERAR